MSVHTQPAAHPAHPARPAGHLHRTTAPAGYLHRTTAPAGRHGADARLTWWALALPALAFAFLFLLLSGPAEAQAASDGSALGHLVERILLVLG
ncbi:hypothetical protein [Streptomyces sp. NPDC051211]|uniref:hypothetical protein n=1 Tax=Streptomyces sp. NPDC051211 TaxID=3154643 RepID=UPI00344BBEB3